MLFYLSLTILIICFLKTLSKSLKLGYSISIQYILPLCFILFIFVNPLILDSTLIYNEKFNLILLTGVLGLVITTLIIPYDFIDVNKSWNKPILPKFEIKKKWLNCGASIYFCYLLFQMISKVISVGSFSAVFNINRFDQGLGDDYLSGNSVLMLMLFFRIFYYIKLYSYFNNKKYFKFGFLFLVPMLHQLMTALTRFDFVVMFLALLFLIIDEKISIREFIIDSKISVRIRKKIPKIKLLIIILPFFVLLFIYMQVANNMRSGNLESTELSSIKTTDKIKIAVALDLNYYNFIYKIYEEKQKNNISYEFGLAWFYYPILNFIPRTFWTHKPMTSSSPRYTELLYYKLGSGEPVVTFTILGEGYMQFGPFGVFLAPFIFVYFRYLSVSVLKKIKGVKILVLLILFSLITYFRGEQPIFYVILDIIYASIIMKFMSHKITLNTINK